MQSKRQAAVVSLAHLRSRRTTPCRLRSSRSSTRPSAGRKKTTWSVKRARLSREERQCGRRRGEPQAKRAIGTRIQIVTLFAAHLALGPSFCVRASLGGTVSVQPRRRRGRGRRTRLCRERLVLLELRLELVLVVDLGLDERLELVDLQRIASPHISAVRWVLAPKASIVRPTSWFKALISSSLFRWTSFSSARSCSTSRRSDESEEGETGREVAPFAVAEGLSSCDMRLRTSRALVVQL